MGSKAKTLSFVLSFSSNIFYISYFSSLDFLGLKPDPTELFDLIVYFSFSLPIVMII
jgi:hypothetical protein